MPENRTHKHHHAYRPTVEQLRNRKQLWLHIAMLLMLVFTACPLLICHAEEGIAYRRTFEVLPLRVVMTEVEQATQLVNSVETVWLYGYPIVTVLFVLCAWIAIRAERAGMVRNALMASKGMIAMQLVVTTVYVVQLSDKYIATVLPSWPFALLLLAYGCCVLATRAHEAIED